MGINIINRHNNYYMVSMTTESVGRELNAQKIAKSMQKRTL